MKNAKYVIDTHASMCYNSFVKWHMPYINFFETLKGKENAETEKVQKSMLNAEGS